MISVSCYVPDYSPNVSRSSRRSIPTATSRNSYFSKARETYSSFSKARETTLYSDVPLARSMYSVEQVAVSCSF